MDAARSLLHGFRQLPAIGQALLWSLFAAVTGGLMNVLIRAAASDIDPIEVVFFRNFFALVVLLPFLARTGLGRLRTSKMGFYALRAGVAFLSMLTWFYGITIVPLASATALNFTAPLFATILAALLLGEQVRARRWSAIAIGFVGVVVILRPFGPFDINMLVLLFSAATAAMGSITVKFLARSEPAMAIVSYMVLYVTPISLIPALFVWQWPALVTWAWLALLGLFGALSHYGTTQALAAADASAIASFEFLKLPYAAFLGYIFFAERPDIWTWLGAAIIVASSLYVAHREARLARQNPARVSGGRPSPIPPS